MCRESEYFIPRDLLIIIPTIAALLLTVIVIALGKENVITVQMATGLGILGVTVLIVGSVSFCLCSRCFYTMCRRDSVQLPPLRYTHV